jgi:outer membrane protein OmpA-like peptidoglycan-associated protein
MVCSKTIKPLLPIILALLVPAIVSHGRELEIRQAKYRFNMGLVQDVVARTFVITERQKAGTVLAVAYFPLGQSVLSPEEEHSVLNDLATQKITRQTPLVIIGYTCPLGPDRLNRNLSLERAKAVAGILRSQGYLLKKIQGKGEQNPVTLVPAQFFRNRRAEIRLLGKEDSSIQEPY